VKAEINAQIKTFDITPEKSKVFKDRNVTQQAEEAFE